MFHDSSIVSLYAILHQICIGVASDIRNWVQYLLMLTIARYTFVGWSALFRAVYIPWFPSVVPYLSDLVAYASFEHRCASHYIAKMRQLSQPSNDYCHTQTLTQTFTFIYHILANLYLTENTFPSSHGTVKPVIVHHLFIACQLSSWSMHELLLSYWWIDVTSSRRYFMITRLHQFIAHIRDTEYISRLHLLLTLSYKLILSSFYL